jgi:hypothetical protein
MVLGIIAGTYSSISVCLPFIHGRVFAHRGNEGEQMLHRRFTQIETIIHRLEKVTLRPFGLAMLLITMWDLLKAHLP